MMAIESGDSSKRVSVDHLDGLGSLRQHVQAQRRLDCAIYGTTERSEAGDVDL
jgi:hypothetical protein